MERIKKQEKLKENLVNYNEVILETVEKKKPELPEDAKYYFYDFDNAKAVLLENTDIENAPYLLHIWAEYDFDEEGVPWEKTNFFCKDIDAGTGNVHVIPGIVQKFERKTEKPDKMSYITNENGEIILRNVQANQRPFAEPCENKKDSWWVPTENINHIINQKNEMTAASLALRKSFLDLRAEMRCRINKGLPNGIKCGSRGGYGNLKTYTFLVWINVNIGETGKMLSTFKIGYTKECGLIARFNVLDYNGNSKKTDKRIFKTVYKSFDKDKEIVLTELDERDLKNIADRIKDGM